MRVEVVYALPQRQCLIAVEVEPGCTAVAAAQRSGIAEQFPEINWRTAVLGVFGQVLEHPADHVLSEGDRVEIYRSLLIDPKAERRQRALQSAKPSA